MVIAEPNLSLASLSALLRSRIEKSRDVLKHGSPLIFTASSTVASARTLAAQK
jgi:hypothetical protein